VPAEPVAELQMQFLAQSVCVLMASEPSKPFIFFTLIPLKRI
jgi:hypothetical protein